MKQEPYIEKTITTVVREYNPDYGDDRLCVCGHKYYRHFDTYENMSAVGCKYCGCVTFEEFTGNTNELLKWTEKECPNEYEELMTTMKEQNFPQAWLVENCVELKYNFDRTYGQTVEPAYSEHGLGVAVEAPDVCEHSPGKFLGHTFSKNYERYECTKCGEEIHARINR